MPGPGGGSHGGGFGGGAHGGSGRGPMPRRGPHRGGFYRRPYRGCGGCLGSFMGMMFLPIILLLVVVILGFSLAGSAFTHIANGGEIKYDEVTFQNYADRQYAVEFASSGSYEDNLLIVFLTNEDANDYYTIAWVGDNIRTDINNLFGNEYTAFGRAVLSSVNDTYYAYSLDSNLASVMDTMTNKVMSLGLESSFRSEPSYTSTTTSHVTNHTELSVTEETVNRSLENFTEETGIPTVIVIDTMENVFGKSISVGDIFVLIITVALLALAVYLIVRAFRNRKQDKENDDRKNSSYNESGDY